MTSWPTLDATLLADVASTYSFRLGAPTALAITRDGAVLFRRTAARGFAADLFELAPDGSVTTLLPADPGDEQLSDAEKARRERSRTATRGVVDIDVSEDGRLVLAPLGAVFHLVDRATKTRRTIDPGGPAYDPHLAPDGSAIAFVRDGDLWVIGTAPGDAPRLLAQHPDGFEYGVAEFAAQEELGRRRGFWWSPDSASIEFQRSDLRAVETIYVADARHPEKPPVPFKYPRAGTPNAVVDLGVVALAGGPPRWFALPAHYLAAVSWPRNAPLTALVLDRAQTDVTVMTVDPPRTLHHEHDDAWINVNAGAPRWLADGAGFLWMTEEPGAWVLELHRLGAAPVELTAPALGLRRLAGIVDGEAIVEAAADPTIQDVYRIPLTGGAPVRITDGTGYAQVVQAAHGVVVVETAHVDGARTFAAISARGTHALPSVAELPPAPTTVRETVEHDGRTFHVAITRPRTFDPARRYPVLLKVYAGPHVTKVTTDGRDFVLDQWYADAGFIVVRTDGRGTPDRGRAWERAVVDDLLTIPLADQIAALRATAARHAELDLARAGIFGWSFGGYIAALGALLHPELFRAAIAGAPVTDWALYDTAYTERYMRTPTANPDGYRRTSALTHAGKLAVPLLLIHGITDDNVHFAHTLALLEELYVHARRAEVITLSATHMVPDPRLALAREQVQVEFFRQHLAPR
jgi:dipeptidyl-peptidase 4